MLIFFINQAAIKVSGEALTLAYTGKSFQWHLQLHSGFTGRLQALHTAASGRVALTPGVPSPRHFFYITLTASSACASSTNVDLG